MLVVFTKKGSYHRLKYGDLKPELDSEPTTIQVDGVEIERLISLELVKSNIAKKTWTGEEAERLWKIL